jgi:hypothetical protein
VKHKCPDCGLPHEAVALTPVALARDLIAYATEHYTDGGWDVVVECMSAEEIAAELVRTGAVTLAEAVRVYAPLVHVWADRQDDARNAGGYVECGENRPELRREILTYVKEGSWPI